MLWTLKSGLFILPQSRLPVDLCGLYQPSPAQSIHYSSSRVSPSFSVQPITGRSLRLLPVSFVAALVRFDVSINTKEPGTVLMEHWGIMWLPAAEGGTFPSKKYMFI